MTFGQAIATVLRKYAEFNGRAARPEFWWWVLFDALVTGALSAFNVIPVGDHSSVGSVLSGVWAVAVLLPTLAVAVRRLRDAGYGWPHLFWLLVPIAGLVVLVVFLTQPTKTTATAPASAAT